MEDVKTLMVSLSNSENCEAWIDLEALNTEYVLCFCVKHGFVPNPTFDDTLSNNNSLIPMTLKVQPTEMATLETGTKAELYRGKNWRGNMFCTYSDGSYAYLNLDRTSSDEGVVLVNVYQSGTSRNSPQLGYVPTSKRTPLEDDDTLDSNESADSHGFSLKKRRRRL